MYKLHKRILVLRYHSNSILVEFPEHKCTKTRFVFLERMVHNTILVRVHDYEVRV